MPALPLTTDALVLLHRPPAESFQALTLFSAEHGTLAAQQRVAKKSATTHPALDLFDEAELILESSNQGRTWFVKEARILARPAGIARSYESLRQASALAALAARNQVSAESRPAVAALLRTAFAAFSNGAPPHVVFFKSLFVFARDEGYPVKQEWLPTLPRDIRTAAEHLLYTPLAALDSAPAAEAALLTRRLEEYLRRTTELLLD